jgi:hypothetical protein
MQRETARSFCSSWGLTCVGDVGGPWYLAQARCADWNVAEETLLAAIRAIWPFAALMAADEPKEAASGKLETPWERMQLEYSTSSPPGAEPFVAAAAAPDVVVVLTLAIGEPPPPQPAVSRANPATPTPIRNRPPRGGTTRCRR